MAPIPTGGRPGIGGEGGQSVVPQVGDFFEAEDGLLSGALQRGSSSDASEGAYISASASAEHGDQPGSGRALYDFQVSETGDFKLWGRIHSPGVSSNRFWVQVDDGAWTLWRISTGEEWVWDDVHDNLNFGTPLIYSLSAGTHRLAVAHAVLGAQLDSFWVLPADSPRPEGPVVCNPPHAVLLAGECVSSCGSHGDVTCGVESCAGKEEVVAYDCGICCLL